MATAKRSQNPSWQFGDESTLGTLAGSLLPGRLHAEGLPVGLQIVGRDKQDFSVLQLSHAFEQATNIGRRHPKIAL
jgi:amidase